ncbi:MULTISPECIES: hypothetical protein [Halomonadaceae]|uniref:hypothetical protein n=1 Tax=Halomonadaceae TaxID=28256 RepID=UPI0015816D25|nr:MULTISPECIES: hypothetical protein [Halomonas]MDI4636695.1 hypothetical protein [Halomonas sp. BMC7]NUJ61060.1 hypothetical protein [Halomonas taeanensis]
MNSLIKAFNVFIAFGLSAEVHANEWWYIDTPTRLTAEAPDAVPCQIVSEGGLYLDCRVEGLPSQETVLYRTDQENGIFTKAEANNTIATHQGNGIYQESGNFIGKLPTGTDYWGHINKSLIRITKDYYLHPEPETNRAFAYRYGTGPLADDFELPYIENDQDAFYNYSPNERAKAEVPKKDEEPYTPPPEGTYRVLSCYDTCRIELSENEVVEVDFYDLPDYIPLSQPGETMQCGGTFCRDAEGHITALNRASFSYTQIAHKAEVKDGYYWVDCTPSLRNCALAVEKGGMITINKRDLPEHLPMVSDSYECEEALCYENGYRFDDQRVVGLNPDFFHD